MECPHKIQLKTGIIVPCGKCNICKANERQEWVFRLKQEFINSQFSLFVTLTYDPEHLPLDCSVNKRDIQLFLKRLRKDLPSKCLRYYICSEYGDHTFRPHYHGLLFFNCTFDRKFIYDLIEKSWQNGFCSFGDVEEGSIVYCTKYCLKHSITPEGLKPTFRLVSKMNGGLGFNYLLNNSDYHVNSKNLLSVFYNGKRTRMPRYYKDILKKSYYFDDVLESNKQNAINNSYSHNLEQFEQFVKENHFANSNDAISAFNDSLKRSNSTQEYLIIKHTKKQKF